MAQHAGESVTALDAALAVLGARDAELAAADAAVTDAVAAAHSAAVASIGRIDAIRAGVDAVVAYQGHDDGPAAAREFSRHLVDLQREVAGIVAEARSLSHAKAVALQELSARYQRVPGIVGPRR